MKKSFPAIFTLVITLLISKVAFASCLAKPSIEDAAKSASLIFVGTVTKITPAQIAGASLVNRKKLKWGKEFFKIDLVTFKVSEAFKEISSETIEIATSVDGDAGYKFEGGTWLKLGQTYLVYAFKRKLEGTVDESLTEENYGGVAAELRKIKKSLPKDLATEINEFNSKISPYSAEVCGRTTHINDAPEELDKIRNMFPEAKRFSIQTDAEQVNGRESGTFTFLSRLLFFFGLS